MDSQIDEHFRLQEQIHIIDRENESRKLLVRLAVLRLLSLPGTQTPTQKPHKVTEQTQTASQGIPDNVSEKLRDYELRISVLKLQLSTKEKVHEAQIDEMKDLAAMLQKQLDEANSVNLERKTMNLGKKWIKPMFISPPTSSGRSVSLGSMLQSPKSSVFSTASPVFTKLKVLKGKGNSFADFGSESIASKASLKLSLSEKKKPQVYFSSPTSSAESTPIKSAEHEAELSLAPPETSGMVAEVPVLETNEDDNARLPITEVNANLTSISESELYQTANATVQEGSAATDTKKIRMKKIQLLSANSSKIVLGLQGRGLDMEEEDLNSLNYYADDNFHDEHSSPIRPTKRKMDESSEDPPRKRHVFKI